MPRKTRGIFFYSWPTVDTRWLPPWLYTRNLSYLKLARFRGHFPLSGEGSTNGQKTPQSLSARLPTEDRRARASWSAAGRPCPRFSLARQTVRNWIKQAFEVATAANATTDMTSGERTELFKLRKQVKQLTIEREILSKAAAWFARENETVPEEIFGFVKATRPSIAFPRCAGCSKSLRAGTMRGRLARRRSGRFPICCWRSDRSARPSCERTAVRASKQIFDEGIHVSDKRVARLMRERRIHGACRGESLKRPTRSRCAAGAGFSRSQVYRDCTESTLGR